MARTVRSTHLALAVICLALLYLLAHATTGTDHLVHTSTSTPRHAAALLRASHAPPMAAGWPSASAASNASRSRPRCLDFCPFAAAEPEEATEPAAATTSTTRAPPRPRFRGVRTHAAAALPAPRSVSAPNKKTALLNMLPLLAIPFLPPPVAALVALASLTTPARARSADCFKLNHATCAIYPYDNETGTIDRSRRNPDPDLGAVCLHPLCHADSDARLFSMIWAQKHGRVDDPLHIYCTVRTLEGGGLSMLPWRNTWRVHLPVADPGAPGDGDICYVELAHLDYREGYYIRCPAGGGHHQTYCTEFPEEEIAATVWGHRSLTYRAAVGPRYATYQDKYLSDHDEL